MRPARSFLLLLIFLICFTGLHYILPLERYFPSLHDFIPVEVQRESLDESSPGKISTDSLLIAVDSIENADTSVIFSPLHELLDSLKLSKGQTRIIYYGDSQIEGDRITSYLRQSLRSISGGTGPGLLLPVMPVMYTKTAWVISSPNWIRYNYLSYQHGELSHRRLGPFMAICRYLPEKMISGTDVEATVKIKPSRMADRLSSVYDQLRIFYSNTEGNVDVKIVADNLEIFRDSLLRGEKINELRCALNNPEDIEITFSGKVSPDIYGISIESEKGLVIDNIPQRGSAGLEFTMTDRKNLAESYRLIKPDLFVLHYGLNIVRNVRTDYSYYGKGLARQIALLKELCPGTPVVVIGLTDMASREGDSIRSFRNIPAIIDAQRKAALSEDAVFWNAWMAMGGKSSIIRWASKDPPLAQSDYVHLTYNGADTLSGILIDSLFYLPSIKINQQSETITAKPVQPVTVVSDDDRIIKKLLEYDPENPMIFSSPAFWLFLLVVLAGYSLVYKKLFLRNFYLLIFSIFFYYKSGGLFVLLLILVIVVDYSCGLVIGTSGKRFVRKLFILLSILSNLLLLGYFKYAGFITESINSVFGTVFVSRDFLAEFSNIKFGTHFDITNIILPVGISFFTFQSLSYTIDVYRQKIKPVKNILDFGFFVSFFPQLVAGPIVRASEFIPQIYSQYHLDSREFGHALFLISKGLIKKIIISDFIAVNFIDRVFEAPYMYSGFENLMAIYGYGLQIYCDFSGYTDIAIGIGLILGFRLPVNFNSPYKARGLQDFWRRWHISLSRWLKDYLYIPLGGNRKGRFRTNLNLLITMVIGGLWHGADLRFIIWGFLHGIGLVIEKIFRFLTGKLFEGSFAARLFVVFITFNFVNFCWIFFRAPDIESVRVMLSQIIANFSPGNWLTVLITYRMVFLLIGAGYLIHVIPENIKESLRGYFITIPLPAKLALIMLVAIVLFSMRSVDTVPFIYFRF